MIQKTFNIELTLDVDDSHEYVDMKMNTYYEAYKVACNLEEKARKKEKKLRNYSDLAGTDSYKEARDAWEKAHKDWQVKAEIRHFSWQVYYQSTKQLRESDKK